MNNDYINLKNDILYYTNMLFELYFTLDNYSLKYSCNNIEYFNVKFDVRFNLLLSSLNKLKAKKNKIYLEKLNNSLH